MLIEGMHYLWRPPVSMDNACENRFDELVAKNGVGSQLRDSLRSGAVAAGAGNPFDQGLTTKLGQIIGGASGVVVRQFRAGEFRHFEGEV